MRVKERADLHPFGKGTLRHQRIQIFDESPSGTGMRPMFKRTMVGPACPRAHVHPLIQDPQAPNRPHVRVGVLP